jgi:predicted nucleic acid-binding protein
MLIGVDTTFMVEADIVDHAFHVRARSLLHDLIKKGDQLAIAPQVLCEYLHVVTDPRRFEQPLTVETARARVRQWWTSRETRPVFPDANAVSQFQSWMDTHRLGRQRILDTMLAATWHCAGITRIVSTNRRDYRAFGVFELLEL